MPTSVFLASEIIVTSVRELIDECLERGYNEEMDQFMECSSKDKSTRSDVYSDRGTNIPQIDSRTDEAEIFKEDIDTAAADGQQILLEQQPESRYRTMMNISAPMKILIGDEKSSQESDRSDEFLTYPQQSAFQVAVQRRAVSRPINMLTVPASVQTDGSSLSSLSHNLIGFPDKGTRKII